MATQDEEIHQSDPGSRPALDAGIEPAWTEPAPDDPGAAIPQTPPVQGTSPGQGTALEENAAMEQITGLMQQLLDTLQMMQEGFDSKIRYDASKERVIDTLHQELKMYRDGLHFQIIRPIVFSLIGMHDDLGNLLKYNRAGEDPVQQAERLRQNLASFQDSVESVLEQHGIEAYNEPGELFVSQRQRVLRSEPTSDPAKDRIIAQRLRKGFAYEGRVVRPESVVAYKYVAPQPPAEDNPA